jgi:hypothetical protein
MPEDAQLPATATGPVLPSRNGLAGVDLLEAPTNTRSSSTSRFEEYKVDGDGLEGSVGDIAVPTGDIEVVRVKRKKKKPIK